MDGTVGDDFALLIALALVAVLLLLLILLLLFFGGCWALGGIDGDDDTCFSNLIAAVAVDAVVDASTTGLAAGSVSEFLEDFSIVAVDDTSEEEVDAMVEALLLSSDEDLVLCRDGFGSSCSFVFFCASICASFAIVAVVVDDFVDGC